jgi:MurNAc alpha-1-phosphate uridylyltransferase
MGAMPHTAMVLAAGFGLRMRPLTLEKPKPLLEVGGRTMLDQVLDRLQEASIPRVVVNAHYHADLLEKHIKQRDASIHVSKEAEILDTGGGIKYALPHLGNDPIFVINADLPWRDEKESALNRLATYFNPETMDALLLLMPREKARGFDGAAGDFFMEGQGAGRLSRHNKAPPRPYVFIAAQIVKPQLFAAVPQTVFSNNIVWDEAEKAGRLHGLVHQGSCYHVGTPGDLAEANRLLAEGRGW